MDLIFFFFLKILFFVDSVIFFLLSFFVSFFGRRERGGGQHDTFLLIFFAFSSLFQFFPVFSVVFLFSCFFEFFTFGQVTSNGRDGRSLHRPTNQRLRVCEVHLATPKVATMLMKLLDTNITHVEKSAPKFMYCFIFGRQ